MGRKDGHSIVPALTDGYVLKLEEITKTKKQKKQSLKARVIKGGSAYEVSH